MKEGIERQAAWKRGSGALVLLVISAPLYREFFEPGQTIWNVSLAIFLAALIVGTFLLQLYFVGHAHEMGEARFDTRNKDKAGG